MKKNKKKQKPLYKKIAEIIQNETITRDGFGHIGWSIAKRLVANYSEQDQIEMLGSGLPKRVRDLLDKAIKYLLDLGTPLYKAPPQGKIEILSPDPKYKEADLQRIEKRLGEQIESGIENLEKKHSRSLYWAKKRLLPYLKSENL